MRIILLVIIFEQEKRGCVQGTSQASHHSTPGAQITDHAVIITLLCMISKLVYKLHKNTRRGNNDICDFIRCCCSGSKCEKLCTDTELNETETVD